jgi:hypothetical protein
MRHNPTNPAPRKRPSAERTADSPRSGIRALDCGEDAADDGTRTVRRSADESSHDRAPLDAGPTSLGEQQQSV